MRISTRARYGTRLMLELAIHYDSGPVFLKDIAKAEEISEKYLSQIIIPLKTAGLVNSFRGARGGYILAKSPLKINLKDVVEVLEGGLDLLNCIKNPSNCSRVSGCTTRDVWNLLGETIAQKLQAITLDELARAHKKKEEKVVTYNI